MDDAIVSMSIGIDADQINNAETAVAYAIKAGEYAVGIKIIFIITTLVGQPSTHQLSTFNTPKKTVSVFVIIHQTINGQNE